MPQLRKRQRIKSPPSSESESDSESEHLNPLRFVNPDNILHTTRTRHSVSFDHYVDSSTAEFKRSVLDASTHPPIEEPQIKRLIIPKEQKTQYVLVQQEIAANAVTEDQILSAPIPVKEKAWLLEHLKILRNTPRSTKEHYDLKHLIHHRLTQDTLSPTEEQLEKQLRERLNVNLSLRKRILQSDLPIDQKSVVYDRYLSVESSPTDSEEYVKAMTWISWALKVPQTITPMSSTHLTQIIGSLNEHIHGQNHVKERILDIAASIMSNPHGTNRTIALVGPPGTGKTAIAHLLARVLGLPFSKLSLGGVNDVTALVGSTSTYISSMPGLIARNLCTMESLSGVFFFDEFDKVPDTPEGQGVSRRLLHIIDPTQNHSYEDLYLTGIKLDLSRLFFVLALNDETRVDSVLRDRMTIIRMDSYSRKDKRIIAKEHFIPRIERELNIKPGSIIFPKQTLDKLIELSPSSKGVRSIEKTVQKVWQRLNTAFFLQTLSSAIPGLSYNPHEFKIPYTLTPKQVAKMLEKDQATSRITDYFY